MISQKMISVKLDVEQLERLDELCASLGCNRNKMINFAVKMVCEHLTPRESLLVYVYKLGLKELGF